MAGFRIDIGKLQHIYDLHAEDFGLSGSKNLQQLQKLQNAIESHLSDADTKQVQGQYRGQDCNLHSNTRTQNVVVTNRSDEVVASFRTSAAQAGYITSTGRLN